MLHELWDEIRLTFRSRRGFLLLFPLIASILSGGVYWNSVIRGIPVGLWDMANTSQSRTLARSIDASPQIDLQKGENLDVMRQEMQKGNLRGIVILQENSIQLERDASNLLIGNQVYAVVANVVAMESARLGVPQLMRKGIPASQAKDWIVPLRLDSRNPANPYYDYFSNLLPGLITAYFLMALMFVGSSFHTRRSALPRMVWWLFLAVSISALSGMVPFLPSLLLYTAALSMGFGVGGILPHPIKATQILLAFNAPAFLLSGYTFPDWAFPPALAAITQWLPFSLYLNIPSTQSLVALGLYSVIPWLFPRRPLPSPLPIAGMATLLFVAPIAYLVLYGSVYTLKEERELPLAVVTQSDGPITRQLLRELDAHPRLRVVAIEDSLHSHGILQFPNDLETRWVKKQSSSFVLIIRSRPFLTAGDLQRSINDVFASHNPIPPPLVFLDHPVANPLESYGDFMLPGLGILIMHQLILVTAAFAAARRIVHQSPRAILWRLVRFTLWFGAWAMVWVGIGLWIFDVQVHIPWFSVLIWVFWGLFAAGALGTLIGTLFRDQRTLLQGLGFTSYPFYFISGVGWPRDAFPSWIDAIGQIIPLRPLLWGMDRSMRFGLDFMTQWGSLLHLMFLAGLFLGATALWIHWQPKAQIQPTET